MLLGRSELLVSLMSDSRPFDKSRCQAIEYERMRNHRLRAHSTTREGTGLMPDRFSWAHSVSQRTHCPSDSEGINSLPGKILDYTEVISYLEADRGSCGVCMSMWFPVRHNIKWEYKLRSRTQRERKEYKMAFK